jgi:hypothetical protein
VMLVDIYHAGCRDEFSDGLSHSFELEKLGA